MGIRPRNSGDRLRTVWTPEMDRCFIDLMLEQVNKGNRFDDHLFGKRAWKNMAVLFNARFESQYEKDVLKNRHKTLRNLYKAVTNLTEQRGFCWDETRQMVTAENDVWDEHIKAHPDARSFRIKTIPYYNDLCLIYKDSISQLKEEIMLCHEKGMTEVAQPSDVVCDDREQFGIHDIIIDEDYEIAVVENEVDVDVSQRVVAPNPGKVVASACRTRTYWQPPMDRYFIDLMLDQIRRGNRIDGVFRKQSWIEMIALFNDKFGFGYEIDVIKNRYKTLKRQYRVVKSLLELDGFVWDDSRQMVTADDYVWQDYIKTRSDARQFMTRPIPYFKDLRTICDDETSFGQHSDEDMSPTTSISKEKQVFSDDFANKRRLDPFSSPFLYRSKKSRENDEGMASTIREMTTVVVSSLSDNKNTSEENSIAIESVIEAVQALPDMDEDFVLDACDLLEDDKKAKTFMALDAKLRRKWLLRKLRPQTPWI